VYLPFLFGEEMGDTISNMHVSNKMRITQPGQKLPRPALDRYRIHILPVMTWIPTFENRIFFFYKYIASSPIPQPYQVPGTPPFPRG
jgi:hypothetical protein